MKTKDKIKKALDKGLIIHAETNHPEFYRMEIFPITLDGNMNQKSYLARDIDDQLLTDYWKLDKLANFCNKIIQTLTPQEIFEPEPFEEGEEVLYNNKKAEIENARGARKYKIKIKKNNGKKRVNHNELKYPTEEPNEQIEKLALNNIEQDPENAWSVGEEPNKQEAPRCEECKQVISMKEKIEHKRKEQECDHEWTPPICPSNPPAKECINCGATKTVGQDHNAQEQQSQKVDIDEVKAICNDLENYRQDVNLMDVARGARERRRGMNQMLDIAKGKLENLVERAKLKYATEQNEQEEQQSNKVDIDDVIEVIERKLNNTPQERPSYTTLHALKYEIKNKFKNNN